MNYKIDDNRVYLSIDRGELVNASFLKICQDNNFKFTSITGIGAILDPEVGFYDLDKKDYIKKQFLGDYELTSLIGNVTLKENQYFVHSHITFSDIDFKAFGGHLFDCRVAVAAEFVLRVGDKKVIREYNNDIGLHIWNCRLG